MTRHLILRLLENFELQEFRIILVLKLPQNLINLFYQKYNYITRMLTILFRNNRYNRLNFCANYSYYKCHKPIIIYYRELFRNSN